MKNKRNLFSIVAILIIVAMLSVSLVGCGSKTNTAANEEPQSATAKEETTVAEQPEAESEPAETKEKIVIGMTWQNCSDEYITLMRNIAESYVEYYYPEVEFLQLDAGGSVETQIGQVESFVVQGVDCIIIQPLDNGMLAPAAKAAIEAGVPVVANGLFDERVGESFAGSLHEQAGAAIAQYIVDQLGGAGNVAMLRGPIGHPAEVLRGEGSMSVFEQYPDINIVFDQTANWARDEGMQLMENWLQTGQQIDAVCSQNDAMALGAMTALEAAGKLDETIVVGVDGIRDALNSIGEGKMDATAYQDPRGQLEACIDSAVALATGGQVEDKYVDYPLITADNLEEWYDRLAFCENPDYSTLE